MNIGLCITGSFCTYEKIKKVISSLLQHGNNVIPILSNSVLTTDTMFGKAKDFIKDLKELTGNDIISNIVQAEPLGPKNAIDVLVVAPCTGNTLSKLANGISDDGVTMSAKAHMRNYKPLILAISTNDALGLNMKNLATMMNAKNVYLVPFEQDDPVKKPKSLISNLDLLEPTIEKALKGEQIQPVIIK